MNDKIKEELLKIIENYNFSNDIKDIDTLNNGNINTTFVVTTNDKKYIIQKINTQAFKEPFVLMKNIENVTNHIEKFNKDTNKQYLKVIKTKDGESLCTIDNDMGDRHYYRTYNFIENSTSYDNTNDKDIVYNAGKGFGNFTRALNDYPINELYETIKDFHNTPKRYEDLMTSIKNDPKRRCEHVSKEILYFLQHEDDFDLITKAIKQKRIPLRVTHNDTKINNVMMDKNTNEFICVVDLDTVMPGSILYDYGDGIRSVAATAKEDERDLDLVKFNHDVFYSFTDGFLSETSSCLTEDEINYMGSSIELITNELAMRFLTDYINGDTYFKTNYPDHNLVRARNQLKLAKEIENNMDNINESVMKLTKKYGK